MLKLTYAGQPEAYANFVLIPDQSKEYGLSKERLIISSIGLGVFLFCYL